MEEKEKPKMQKVIDTPVTVKKASTGKKLASIFFSDETDNIGDHIVFDLLIPAIKDTIVNIITNGIAMLFYGKPGTRLKSSGGRVLYDQFSKKTAPQRVSRSVYDCDSVVFPDYGSADLVLDQLIEYIDRYRQATVLDFYDACGVTSTSYNDQYYGWTDLRNARISRVSGGFVINLPRPEQLR